MLSQKQVQKQVLRSFLPPASSINQCHLYDGKFMMAHKQKKWDDAKEREKNLIEKKQAAKQRAMDEMWLDMRRWYGNQCEKIALQ